MLNGHDARRLNSIRFGHDSQGYKFDLSLYGNKQVCRMLDNKDVEGIWTSDIL
jgi:hypothetical protein